MAQAPSTHTAFACSAASLDGGDVPIRLAADQAWRAIRKLG